MKHYFLTLLFLLYSCANTSGGSYPDVDVKEDFLEKIVSKLASDIGPRNYENYTSLQSASAYIQDEFRRIGYEVELQKYTILGKEVENIIVSIGPKDGERIIVGAHYDSFGDQPGADDNASGIAGLIALAGLLKNYENELNKRVDLVAFTLEEPPFFRSEGMGSFIHAKSLKDSDINVRGMISLEMIGYFRDEKDTQDYPLSLLHLFYPDQGNYIGIVSNISSSGLKSEFRDYMEHSSIKIRSLAAPAGLVGVDFSDHLNYWKFGYDAIMITDTAFYRNKNYHQPTDRIETLDFSRMADVVVGVFYGVLNLAGH